MVRSSKQTQLPRSLLLHWTEGSLQLGAGHFSLVSRLWAPVTDLVSITKKKRIKENIFSFQFLTFISNLVIFNLNF